jgi:predicted RNA-binding Zn-ribbon protein involved in translation (DUF1610 family)
MNELPELSNDRDELDREMRAGLRELANSQRCNDCLYIGAPGRATTASTPQSGEIAQRSMAMTAYRCPECQWTGAEPEQHTVYGDPASGEAYWVIEQSCPDCGHDQLDDCDLCVDCQDEGIDTEATHDERCKPHHDEHLVCEAEETAEYRRDQIDPVYPLVRSNPP